MIHDLDETLKALLTQKLPGFAEMGLAVKFETPNSNETWVPKPTSPVINLFLYDIRENLQLRSNERFISRQGPTATETRAPVSMDMTYLVTVWTTQTDDEHRLLGQVLKTLLRYPLLPEEEDILQGELRQAPSPIRAWIAQPERTPNVWDMWGAVEGSLKAGISYTVTVPITPTEPVTGIPVVTEEGGTQTRFRVYGQTTLGEPLLRQRPQADGDAGTPED